METHGFVVASYEDHRNSHELRSLGDVSPVDDECLWPDQGAIICRNDNLNALRKSSCYAFFCSDTRRKRKSQDLRQDEVSKLLPQHTGNPLL